MGYGEMGLKKDGRGEGGWVGRRGEQGQIKGIGRWGLKSRLG